MTVKLRLAMVIVLCAVLTAPLTAAARPDLAASAAPQPCIAGPVYDPACDVDYDGDVDMFDIQLAASHWNQNGVWTGGDFWSLLGKASANPVLSFDGTSDNQLLVVRTNNLERLRVARHGQVGIGLTSPVDQPSAATELSGDACIPGDPYDLEQLIQVMSRPNPPTAPVQLNDDLSLVYVGVGDMTAVGDDDIDPGPAPRPNPNPSEPDPTQTRYGPIKIRAFNTANRFMFDITMSERMLKRIGRCREQAGLTSADGGEAGFGPAEGWHVFLPLLLLNGAAGNAPASDQRGWSNGSDTRIIRTPTTLWPWRTIAQQSFVGDDESRCTQTLIGPRHMVTAAHCIVNFGTTAWKTRVLTPGRNGPGISPYGNTTITPNPAPGDTVWYFVPSQWTDPGTSNQWVWDWGMVVIPDYLGYQTGWMGYGAWSAGVLNNETHLNRGYPRCNVPSYNGEPAGCQQARLYGDTNVCELGDYSDQLADGWNRRISVSCDLSKGHSGSAIYHYRYDSHLGMTVPVVTMVASTESCTNTCSSTNDYPNGARRLTPADVDVISFFREAFP